VKGGVYHESLNISKKIVLAGSRNPLLDPGARGNAITLRANGTVVSGFEIRTTRRTGIYVLSDNNTINNNTISGCLDGIRLDHSDHNYIVLNDINNNTNGIALISSQGNTIDNNEIRDNDIDENSDCGIFLAHSKGNILRHNDMQENGDCSISLLSSSYNLLLGNDVCRSDWYGIALTDSSNNNLIAKTMQAATRLLESIWTAPKKTHCRTIWPWTAPLAFILIMTAMTTFWRAIESWITRRVCIWPITAAITPSETTLP